MKMQIKKFSELTGVSVRTLHYYDEIELLKPEFVDEQNGYRFYGQENLEKMEEILFYRELDFSLKEIAEILSSPDYNKNAALTKQKELLTLKKKRLECLIAAIENSLKGVKIMDTKVFNNTEFESAKEQYKKEARARWGKTDAYKEYEKKTENYSNDKIIQINKGLDDIFGEFAELVKVNEIFSNDNAQNLVKKLQKYITENFYCCTNEILAGLGRMYIDDERFRENIDRHEKGTAEFVSKSIEHYCKTC